MLCVYNIDLQLIAVNQDGKMRKIYGKEYMESHFGFLRDSKLRTFEKRIADKIIWNFLSEEKLTLDSGSGFGKNIIGHQNVIPVDVSAYAADFIYKNFHIQSFVMDGQNIGFDGNSFENVICSHVLEHVGDFNKVIEEIYRILKPGGKLVVLLPSEKTRQDPTHIHKFTHSEMKSLLELKGFKVVKSTKFRFWYFARKHQRLLPLSLQWWIGKILGKFRISQDLFADRWAHLKSGRIFDSTYYDHIFYCKSKKPRLIE
jgi:SAM-dependent methyltransferase